MRSRPRARGLRRLLGISSALRSVWTAPPISKDLDSARSSGLETPPVQDPAYLPGAPRDMSRPATVAARAKGSSHAFSLLESQEHASTSRSCNVEAPALRPIGRRPYRWRNYSKECLLLRAK
jgi:hypothetical protein